MGKWQTNLRRGRLYLPAETLGEIGGGGDGGLGGPVVVRRVSGRGRRRRGVERVLGRRRRREGAELGAEAGDLAEVGWVDEMALALSPLGPPVLEPNLKMSYVSSEN